MTEVTPTPEIDAREDSITMTRTSRLLLLLMLAVGLLALAPAAMAAGRPVAKLSPTSGALFGSYTNYVAAGSRAQRESLVTQREQQMGHKFDIDHTYDQWTTPFPNDYDKWDVANGRIPFINWKGVNSNTILNGSQDALIRARAEAVKALGVPYMIQYYGEMDRRSVSEIGTPSQFIAAWRHIVDIFRSVGATNAVWVWCPTGDSFRTGVGPKFYPGDSYVDWTCFDAYNWGGKRWRSFADTMKAPYDWLSIHIPGKPILVGEWGATENGGSKAAWLDQVAPTLQSSFPNIEAVVYFDSHPTDSTSGYDWRSTTSQSALAAWIRMAKSPYFTDHNGLSGGGGPPPCDPTQDPSCGTPPPCDPTTQSCDPAPAATPLAVSSFSARASRHTLEVAFRVSAGAQVKLRITTARGKAVRTLRVGQVGANVLKRVWWMGKNDHGRHVRRGTYRVQLVAVSGSSHAASGWHRFRVR